MMTVKSGTGNNMQTVRYNMNAQADSVSKRIQEQITDAQKRMQELSADKDMTLEDKMKKRQEIQQEIANLNQQLRQHQIEQRKEQQSKNASAKENNPDSQKTDAAKQGAGFSSTGVTAILSADSSMKQARVQGSVATQMEGRAGVLEIEIKQDGSRGGDTSAKEAELAEAEQKAEDATGAQLNTLAEANRTMTEAAEEDRADNKAAAEREDNKHTDKTDKDDQKATGESDELEKNADIKTGVSPLKAFASSENATGETEVRPAAKKHIDMYL